MEDRDRWEFIGIYLWKIQKKYYTNQRRLYCSEDSMYYQKFHPLLRYIKNPHNSQQIIMRQRRTKLAMLGCLCWNIKYIGMRYQESLEPIDKMDKFSNQLVVINRSYYMYPITKPNLLHLEQNQLQAPVHSHPFLYYKYVDLYNMIPYQRKKQKKQQKKQQKNQLEEIKLI